MAPAFYSFKSIVLLLVSVIYAIIASRIAIRRQWCLLWLSSIILAVTGFLTGVEHPNTLLLTSQGPRGGAGFTPHGLASSFLIIAGIVHSAGFVNYELKLRPMSWWGLSMIGGLFGVASILLTGYVS